MAADTKAVDTVKTNRAMPKNGNTYQEVKTLILGNEKRLADMIPAKVSDLKVRTILDQIDHQLKFSRNAEKLKSCEPSSIAAAIKYCCQLGLEPGYGNGTPDVYLIPYARDCQTQLSYRGELNLAMRDGKFKLLYSDVIYISDAFTAWNDAEGQHFRHEMGTLEGRNKDNMLAVFAAATTDDGCSYLEVMTVDEINELERKTRKGEKQTPAWRDWWTQMARKTLLRKVVKNLPQSSTQALAESLDNRTSVIDVQAEQTNVKQIKSSEEATG
jgi:recombination protein RecT